MFPVGLFIGGDKQGDRLRVMHAPGIQDSHVLVVNSGRESISCNLRAVKTHRPCLRREGAYGAGEYTSSYELSFGRESQYTNLGSHPEFRR